LNAIAVGATASYLAAHPSSANVAVTLAGYSVAAITGASVLLGASVLAVALINSEPLPRRAAR
jgi:hypothetical protein